METPETLKEKRKCRDNFSLAAPKKKKCFESKISKWKKERDLDYKVHSYLDQDNEEYVIITQRLQGQLSDSIILYPGKAKLLIDDVRSHLLDYERKRFKNEMQNVFFQTIRENVFQVRREMCEGCLENYPSQLHHYCLTTETKEFIEDSFSNLLKVVDEEEANEICNETLKMDGEFKYSKSELLADEEWVASLKSKILQFLES